MSEFDSLVWETKTLAKVSFVPLMKKFPQYKDRKGSDLPLAASLKERQTLLLS